MKLFIAKTTPHIKVCEVKCIASLQYIFFIFLVPFRVCITMSVSATHCVQRTLCSYADVPPSHQCRLTKLIHLSNHDSSSIFLSSISCNSYIINKSTYTALFICSNTFQYTLLLAFCASIYSKCCCNFHYSLKIVTQALEHLIK